MTSNDIKDVITVIEQELKDETEQAVKRGGEIYAKNYMEGLLDGIDLVMRKLLAKKSMLHLQNKGTK